MAPNRANIVSTQVGNNSPKPQNVTLKQNTTTITITDEVVGNGMIRLISPKQLVPIPNNIIIPEKISVPLYKVTISDLASQKVTEYAVTRDAPVLDINNPYEEEVKTITRKYTPFYDLLNVYGPHYKTENIKTGRIFFNIINTAFEPKSSTNNVYIGRALRYPENTTDLEAYALRTLDDKESLPAEPVNNPIPHEKRKNINFATGVMIHVGGEFTNRNGYLQVTGSFGCFGIFRPMEGNAGIKEFVRDVVSRNNNFTERQKIRIHVIKRNNVKWHLKIDENGNIIK